MMPRPPSPPTAPQPAPDRRLLAWHDPSGAAAERFRLFAERLYQWREATPGPARRALALTSTIGAEGKTLTAANLALTLARATRARVLLVEGDLRQAARPTSLERLWGLPHRVGLGDWLAAPASSLNRFVYPLGPDPLWLLPAGPGAAAPLDFLAGPAAGRCLESLASSFAWIIIDAPPLLPLPDAAAWCRHADGFLLVLREAWTLRPLVERALAGLDRSRLVGVTVNDSREAEREARRWSPPRPRVVIRLKKRTR